jgi:hypothetical protein
MGDEMKTIRDVVLEHVKMKIGGTQEGLDLLELRGSPDPEHNNAANFYLTALRIIRDLQKENERLQEKLEQGNHD